MQSTIGWLDYSEKHQRQMMEVVGIFREKNTVDDLGIGTLRDTFSNLLFPGTTTLYTRTKYLLFVPWICQRMEADRTPSHYGWDRLKDLEVRLIGALDNGGEETGVIGIDAREKLKQFPSFVYWGGIGAYGIRALPYDRGAWVASLDDLARSRRNTTEDDEGTAVGSIPQVWHRELPPAEPDFLEVSNFALTPAQASYLTDRIQASFPGSFLAHLVASDQATEADFPWEHPVANDLPDLTANAVTQAQRFSELMHGAALLYNLMLAEEVHDLKTSGGEIEIDEDLVDKYTERLATWAQLIEQRTGTLRAWDRDQFWATVRDANPSLPHHTRRFVDAWFDLVTSGGPHAVIENDTAREWISARELRMKGKLARLHNPRQLERWGGAAGTGQLGYRWGTAGSMAEEIIRGREGTDAGA